MRRGDRPPGAVGGMPGTWLFAIFLCAFVAGRCLAPMDETDLFYNLRLGEIVLTSHDVPRTNLLSFTAPDHPDPNLAWLFQALLALVHRLGGIPATVVLKTAFVVATFALLFRVALRRGAHPAVAAAVLALAAWTAEPRFVERPHLVTFLGLAALLLALERAEAGRPRLLWMFVPLGLIWANGNSCFFLAPSLLLLYAAGSLLDRASARPIGAHRQAGLVAVALVPLLFATPSGSGWLGYVANHFRMPWVRPLQEYRLAEWPTDAPFLFLLIGVALVTVLLTVLAQPAPRRVAARHVLPIAALAVLGSRRIRFVAEFALLAGPFVAVHGTSTLRQLFAPRAAAIRAGFRAGSWAVLAGLAILTLGPRVQAARAGETVFDIAMEPGLVPVTAIRWIDAHGLRDRLYNDLEVGSYLTWDGWPRHRVFQDPRINAYPDDFHAALRRQDLQRSEWESLLARFGIEAALITYPEVNPRGALFAPEGWALCYRSAEALVFVRRDLAHAALIDAEELPLTFRFDPAAGLEPTPLLRAPSQSPMRDCEWNRRLGDWFLACQDPGRAEAFYRSALAEGGDCLSGAQRDAAREQAGALALRFGDPAKAVALLAGLPAVGARTNRGFALLQVNRAADGLGEFVRALGQAPGDPEANFGRALALARLDRRAEAAASLRAFLDRWPHHFAVPQARALLARLAH
jgi:tetratricopeptide (TPR) repeat protein